MEQKNDFLGRDPIGRLLWRMSLPAIVAQLINLLYNLVDRVYIGHMPEDGARGAYRGGRLPAHYHDCVGICRTCEQRRGTESFHGDGKGRL